MKMTLDDITLLIAVILIFLWLIAGVYITMANVKLGSYKKTDNKLNNAYWDSFWAAFVTWFMVGIFVIILILLAIVTVMGGGEAELAGEGALILGEEAATLETIATQAGKKIAKQVVKQQKKSIFRKIIDGIKMAFLIFSIFLVALTGILAAVAANAIKTSPNYDPSNKKMVAAHKECSIAAYICLVADGLLLIALIIYFIYSHKISKKRKAEEAKQQQDLEQKKALLVQHEKEELRHLQLGKIQALREQIAKQAQYKQELEAAKHQAELQKTYQMALTH